MFRNILVAMDGSLHSEAAIEYGAYLAAEFGAHIEALHVIDWQLVAGHLITHFDDLFRRELGDSFSERVKHYYKDYGERLIEHARQRAMDFGVSKFTGTIESGKVAKHIIEHTEKADLLVIGQHGEAAELETGFIGSVVGQVLHSIKTTALVVQPPMRKFSRALLAYDGSAAADRAMEKLAMLTQAFKLEVDVVHLIEPRKDMDSLKQASAYLARYQINFTTHYMEGDSHLSILEHAKQKECDLLAMGAFADREVEALALGTTTEAMIGHASIPVMVHK